MKGSKKGACSSHTIKAKANALQHDRREGRLPSNVNPHLTKNNRVVFESELIRGRKRLKPLIDQGEKLYREKVKQKVQDTFAVFRESCLVVRPDVTDKQLMDFVAKAEALTGWRCEGVYLHLDEGYKRSRWIEGDEDFKLNYHAHVLWSCQDPETGKSKRADRAKLSKMQDLLGEAVGMERGNYARETGAVHVSSREQRIKAQEERLAKLEAAENMELGSDVLKGLAGKVGLSAQLRKARQERRDLKKKLADSEGLRASEREYYEKRIAKLNEDIKELKRGEAERQKTAVDGVKAQLEEKYAEQIKTLKNDVKSAQAARDEANRCLAVANEWKMSHYRVKWIENAINECRRIGLNNAAAIFDLVYNGVYRAIGYIDWLGIRLEKAATFYISEATSTLLVDDEEWGDGLHADGWVAARKEQSHPERTQSVGWKR